MHRPRFFWPSGRKLFRQQPRLRALWPAIGVMATIALAIIAGHTE